MTDLFNSLSISFYKGNIFEMETSNSIVYRSLGNYDYISIKPFIINSNKSSETEDATISSPTRSEYDSIHTFFGVFNTLNNTINQPTKFFESSKTLYTFISFIQLNYNCNKSSSKQFNDCLKIIQNNLKDVEYMIFNSLDCCDIIVFLKSEKYCDGANIIQQLDNENFIKYSYSVLGIDFTQLSEVNYDEKIDKITICGVIADNCDFNKWYDSFTEKFPNTEKVLKYGRIGNEDVILNILDCKALDFFRCFKDDYGVLNIKNRLFYNALISPRMHFDNFYSPNESVPSPSKPIELNLKEKLINAYINAEQRGLIIDKTIKKASLEVLNSCDFLSKRNFALDIRDCINSSIDLFFEKVQNYIIDEPDCGIIQYNDSIKKYIAGIMSIVNGSLQADRMFFQVPGFNAVLYEIPSKLIIFYTAYVNKVAKIIDDLDSNYGFIVCPDLYQFTYISVLFPEKFTETNLLLKVRIPVDLLFKPKKLLRELTHEVAHFVGKEVRNREERYNIEKEIIAREMMEYLFENDDENVVSEAFERINDFSGFARTAQKKFKNNIQLLVDDFFEKNYGDIADYRYHQVYLHDAFYTSCKAILTNPIEMSSVLKDLIIDCPDDNDVDFIMKKALKFKMALDFNKNTFDYHLQDFIYQLDLLIKESYADLIMILVLDIDLEDYVISFFEPALEQFNGNPAEILYRDVIGERICAVINCFDTQIDALDLQQVYKDQEKQNKLNQFQDELRYFNREIEFEDNHKIPSFSKYSIDKAAEYLKSCKVIFETKNYDVEYIKILYSKIDANMMESIDLIFDFNHSFRDDMFMEIEK